MYINNLSRLSIMLKEGRQKWQCISYSYCIFIHKTSLLWLLYPAVTGDRQPDSPFASSSEFSMENTGSVTPTPVTLVSHLFWLKITLYIRNFVIIGFSNYCWHGKNVSSFSIDGLHGNKLSSSNNTRFWRLRRDFCPWLVFTDVF